jgi:hypothetical protein
VDCKRYLFSALAAVALLANLVVAPAGAQPLRADLLDLGRALPTTSVSLAVALAYRHAAELDQLIRLQGDRRSPLYHRFLTARQFDDYFAPSPEAYLLTTRLLERAGFRITHSYSNRTLIDASAPVSATERYFGTEIHRVAQAGVGIRYANVRPAVLPAELRGIVTSVAGLSDIDQVKPLYRFPDAAGRAAQLERAERLAERSDERAAGRPASAVALRPPVWEHVAARTDSVNLIGNPGFEASGSWEQCGSLRASVTKVRAHTGHYSEFAGSTGGSEIKGDAGLCQAVTVPVDGVLTFWAYRGSNEPNTHYAWQWALLMDARGNVVDSLYRTIDATTGWKHLSYDVAALATRKLFVYFGVHGDGHAGHHTYQFVDDVTLTGTTPATPLPARTPFPAPTNVPTAVPTAMPTAIPTTAPGRGPGAPIAGPLNGPDGGYGPLATAQGYDLPVQHGYDGAGRTAGVVMWGNVLGSDLAAYEQEWGISRTGTTVAVAVDGGGLYNGNINAANNGSVEADLDLETIEGNAPGANIVLYDFPAPTDQDILDAYNTVVAQNVVDVVSSSFGSCESGDIAFATASNQIAAQGLSEGITFSASSGDSGSNACGTNDNVLGVSAPAGDADFVSVGGTSLYVVAGGAWSAESVWNSDGGAGGGGVSSVYALPTYQQGVGGVTGSGRNQPDLALAADPNYGTSVYFNGWWAGPFGGTSWASPLFASYITEVAQMHGARTGFINPSLYNAYRSSGYADYHDITSGNNFGYSARPGYDQASGIGSLSSGYGLASKLP